MKRKESNFLHYTLEKSQFLVFSDSALIAPSNNRLTLTFRIGT